MKVQNTFCLLTFDVGICYMVNVTPGEALIKLGETGLKSYMEDENGSLIA